MPQKYKYSPSQMNIQCPHTVSTMPHTAQLFTPPKFSRACTYITLNGLNQSADVTFTLYLTGGGSMHHFSWFTICQIMEERRPYKFLIGQNSLFHGANHYI